MLAPSEISAHLLVSPALGELSGLAHGFTTRPLGTVAAHPAADDALGNVLPRGRWVRRHLTQVHGSDVHRVQGDDDATEPPRADALVTDRTGELLVIRTADCLPVLLVRQRSGRPQAVAAAHAGWRGLLAGVLEQSVAALEQDAETGDTIAAALGPCIGPCCFEVGPDVSEAWRERLGPERLAAGAGDRAHADLPGAAADRLAALGVAVLAADPPCTRCQPDRHHSHRADGPNAGRQAAFIGRRAGTGGP